MSPVAGRAIIVADDGAGGDTTPTIAIQAWAERFRIFNDISESLELPASLLPEFNERLQTAQRLSGLLRKPQELQNGGDAAEITGAEDLKIAS